MSAPAPRRHPSTRTAARRAAVGAAALALVAASLTLSGPARANASPDSERIAGADRFSTSAEVSASTPFPDAPAEVVVTSGTNYPDGLSAAAYAGFVGGPVLLVPPSGPLPDATADELQRTDPQRVRIVGGTGAVGPDIEAQIAALLPGTVIARFAGTDRYDTAARIAHFLSDNGAVGSYLNRSTAFLATGANFADALAASAPSYSGTVPILLTAQTSIPASTLSALTGIDQVVVLGGTSAVGVSVVSQLEGMGKTVIRVAGANRFLTATGLADRIAGDPDFGFGTSAVVLTSGLTFADALSAGPLAATLGGPILFSEGPATVDFLTEHAPDLAVLFAVGGASAIPDARLSDLVGAATSDTTAPTLVSSTPAAGTAGVPVGVHVSAVFSEPLATTSTVTLKAGATAVAGSATSSDRTVSFSPSARLAPGTAYTATFTVTDLAGNTATVSLSFTTTASDTTPPGFVSSDPEDNDIAIPVLVTPSATYDETLGAASSVTLTDSGGVDVTGTTSVSGPTVTFTPDEPLAASTVYTMTVNATDLVGNDAPGVTTTFTTDDP